MVRGMVGFWGREDLANSCHPDHLTKLLTVAYPKVVAFKSLCFGSTLRNCLLEIDFVLFILPEHLIYMRSCVEP